MAKRKVRVEGALRVTFAPPKPNDLGVDLWFALRKHLGSTSSTQAANPDGTWSFQFGFKDPGVIDAAAKRALAYLKKPKRPRVHAIETWRHYEGFEVQFPTGGDTSIDLSLILPESEEKLSALVFVEINPSIPDIDSLTSDLKRWIARTGKLTAYPDGNGGQEYLIRLRNAFRLPTLLDEINTVIGNYELPAGYKIKAVTHSPSRTWDVQ